MQRIIVDLPDPDGPQITMRSPPRTFRLISRSTWKSPYHLLSPMSSTAVSVLSRPGLRSDPEFSSAVMCCSSPPATLRETHFHGASIARHAVTEDYKKNGGDRVAGRAGDGRCPLRIDAGHLDRPQEIEDANDKDQRRVLEQPYISVDDIRDRHCQRLRQDDEACHLPVAETDGHGAFVLASRNGLQAGANNLRHIGGGEDRNADQRPHQLVGRILRGNENSQHHSGHEQYG